MSQSGSDCLDFSEFSLVLIFAFIEFRLYFGACVCVCLLVSFSVPKLITT